MHGEKKALVIIAKQGFQDRELKGTRDGLLQAGYDVTLASTETGDCTGKLGSTEYAQTALTQVDISEYDTIAFIGGPGARALAENPDAIQLAQNAYKAGDIVIGAICIAPTILAKAGLLKGKQATVFNTDGDGAKILHDNGATFTNKDITIDGCIITGNGPDAAVEFGKELASLQPR